MNRALVIIALLVASQNVTAGFEEGEAAYARGDHATALREFRASAERGNVAAQYNLGVMYDAGEGVAENDAEAVRWYRLAAEQGDTGAQHNLASMYREGAGVAQDSVEAARWYLRAAEQGVARAQYNLGVMYRRGEGVSRDDRQAARWIGLAAEQGLAAAQSTLGSMVAAGTGVPQSDVEAARWWRQAAEQGNADAQVMLGEAHAAGRGVAQDDVAAYAWLNLAAGQDHAVARERRDRLGDSLPPAQRSEAQAMSRDIAARLAARRAPVARGVSSPPGPVPDLAVATQAALAFRGYDPGPLDGVVGPRTRAAIRAFQRDSGLPETGSVSVGLLRQLQSR